jgi:MFS family permease
MSRPNLLCCTIMLRLRKLCALSRIQAVIPRCSNGRTGELLCWALLKSHSRRTFISFFPLVFQQALGIPLIFGYASYFFSLAGVEDPFLATLVVNLVLIVCIIISFYTVERVGRRPSLLAGAGIMGTCTLVVGILGAIKSQNGNALVAMCAIWVAAYALSAGPIGEYRVRFQPHWLKP